MCGIAGFNWEDKVLVKKMCDSLSHRGPDDSGTFVDKGVSLGHRRLSIIDLSKQGHQPMFNEDNTLAVVFNGEIYNFQSIKKDLISKGHRFKSSSDTEVIVHGYAQYGISILSKLEGMFAIAIWDRKKKRLVLARDRVGKKPLYYYKKNNLFIFASEIKSILIHEDVKREINMQCLSDYLSLRFSPGTSTMFKDIVKLPPASYLIYEKGKTQIRSFWSMPPFTHAHTPSEDEVDELIEKAVEKRLVADVPIGVLLSGGLDSSAIVAYLSRLGTRATTFSVGFGDSTDETPYAELIASRFNTKHKTLKLDREIISLLPEVVWHFDEPLADPASIPTFKLCSEVSKHVKVALSGEGGDEVFGGYTDFNYIRKIKSLQRTPQFIGNAASKAFRYSSTFFKYPLKQKLQLASEIAREVKDPFATHKKLFYFPFNESDKQTLLAKEITNRVNLKDPIDLYLRESKDSWDNALRYYFREWLPNDLLMKGDKMGMAHGLELRMPFLDTNLITYFSKIDNSYKQERLLFRRVVSKMLPIPILKRKKQGFILPISTWFDKKDFSERVTAHVQDLSKRRIFNEESLLRIVKNPSAFRNDHRLWTLLNFELWAKIYLDEKSPRSIRL